MEVEVTALSIERMILEGYDRLSEDEIRTLTSRVCEKYEHSGNVLEIPDSNVFFIGDLHGELDCAKAVQRLVSKYENHSFVFLGDYADRGPAQIETFNLVCALAVSHPQRVHMLRGNHESTSVAKRYGFYLEVSRNYPPSVFNYYANVFAALPVAATNGTGVFACHGGVPEGVRSMQDLASLFRRSDEFDDDILFQMVWNDPEERDFKFRPSIRGRRARIFGERAFDEFCSNTGVLLFVRAHQVFEDGFKYFFSKRLVSVFSARYGGRVTPKVLRLGKELRVEILDL
ncbi:MAG: hypothetical protein DRP09_03725 [Candidatus Thorarchaeota archaeon]|nr:MAG: hypothetical protein DRP09_03725 [Candidatus Thorarchaeota archaeon]